MRRWAGNVRARDAAHTPNARRGEHARHRTCLRLRRRPVDCLLRQLLLCCCVCITRLPRHKRRGCGWEATGQHEQHRAQHSEGRSRDARGAPCGERWTRHDAECHGVCPAAWQAKELCFVLVRGLVPARTLGSPVTCPGRRIRI